MDDREKSYSGKEIFFHENIDVPLNSSDRRAYSLEKKVYSHAAPPVSHYKETDSTTDIPDSVQTANTESSAAPPPEMRIPKYDPFMYEPIGFPDSDKKNEQQAAEFFDERGRKRRETTIIVLFVLLIILTIAIGAGGIAYDIYTSPQRIANTESSNQVVIYQNGKPDGANKLIDAVDENGRYSTEGVAAAVRESIVEIYTYGDAFQSELLGTGSGVILTNDGYIVTNAHVLEADGFHEVHTADEKVYSAQVVGRDTKTDIAVLKITASSLNPAVLGDSDEVVVGEQVVAIGNPAGLTGTVTNGIISAVNRSIRSDSTGFEMNCLQTNAAISPGNSGGALVNMYGQVIGITSSKYVSGYYEGLGFAITINEAKPIIEELINNGFISGRFRIGITLIDMSNVQNIAAVREELGFDVPEGFSGIYINDISEDSDIANTALRKGDFIIEINGIPVKTYDELYDTITASYSAGDYVPATCAHIDADGTITEYYIEFMLMEDTSGNY